jgi:hypothetical protein
MKTTLISAVVVLAFTNSAAAEQPVSKVYESAVAPSPSGEIDRIVFQKLAVLGIEPVLCSDAVFLRRAYLDVIGTLPSAEEARAFLEDPDTEGKRRKLIDQLLQRDEFADYWSMKWGDVLRIKAEFPINLWPNAAQAYHRWVRSSIAENKPYDQFIREMLTSSGSNFRVGPVNFYRAIQNKTPDGIATATVLTFMGARAELWPEDIRQGTTVFFSQIGYKPTREWKEECVFWDPAGTSAVNEEGESLQPVTPKPLSAVFPDGTKVVLSPEEDPREVFADWLITPENPWFTRCIANRIWAWLMGRGVIHEPDDIRDDNPPSHPQLLAYLERQLIDSHYDLRHLYRLILNSQTYQLSSIARTDKPEAAAAFASYPLRRLEAEVLIDAINKITGTTDLYTSAIPEPYTYIPEELPAIAVADGSITSPFLALFGRSPRATGMENERNNKITSSQWLHLLNSSHIQNKIERGPHLRALVATRSRPQEKIEQLYLTILSRFPTEEELGKLKEYAGGKWLKRDQWVDVIWALINNTEFLYRH